MLGIAFVLISQFFSEIATAFGKREVEKKEETVYSMGFLNAFWSTIFLAAWGLLGGGSFVFSLESLPFFLLRAVLEIALTFTTLHAVISSDRSTFSFLRILTIPLLLVIDLMLGYSIATMQVAGMLTIVVALIFLATSHGLSAKGKLLSLASAVLAVATITLYKYDIEHFNSVEAEQSFMHFILLISLMIAGWVRGHENVLHSLVRPAFFGQSIAAGVGSVFLSFAYTFAPASVILTAKRSFDILITIASGRLYFHENNTGLKLVAFVLVVIGVSLVALFGTL